VNRLRGIWYRTGWLGLIYVLFAIYILAPLIVTILMSFRDNPYIGFPIESWTTKWYIQILGDGPLLWAFGMSVYVAVASTVLSLIVGLCVALRLDRPRIVGQSAFFALVCLPIVVPSVIQAVALRIFTRDLGMDPGPTSIILAHAVNSAPFVTLILLARLGNMPTYLVQCARDLGADPFVAFLRVTIPFLKPALIGSVIVAMMNSFDDFIRSLILGSSSPTLPVLLFQRMREGMSPALAAIATLIIVLTVTAGLYGDAMFRRMTLRGKR
jgi:spermidine/putrescine transport system permease protein